MVLFNERPEADREFFMLPPPYKLAGPEPDILRGDPHIVYKLGVHRNYYVTVMRGLVLMLEPIGYQPGTSRWFVMFHEDKSGTQKFAEAGSGEMLIRGLWDFVDYVLHCKPGQAPKRPESVTVP